MERQHVNKTVYKLELILLKYIPIILAIISLTHIVLSYYDINGVILDMLGGISILTITFIYISSHVFKFCVTHRIPLYYIIVSFIVDFIDESIGIPISDLHLLLFYFIIAGLFTILYVYCKVKYKNKSCYN